MERSETIKLPGVWCEKSRRCGDVDRASQENNFLVGSAGELKSIGKTPLILDSKDVLENPEAMLSLTCEKLGIRFDEAMLSWPSGSRDSDGIWATYWYASVNASTGFEAWKPKEEQVPAHLKALCLECEALYCVLKEEKLESQNATEV